MTTSHLPIAASHHHQLNQRVSFCIFSRSLVHLALSLAPSLDASVIDDEEIDQSSVQNPDIAPSPTPPAKNPSPKPASPVDQPATPPPPPASDDIESFFD